MKHAQPIIILLLLLFLPHQGKAQSRANKLYNKAVQEWSDYQKIAACRIMQQAIDKDPTNPEPYSKLAEWHSLQHHFYEAAQVCNSGFKNCKNGQRLFAKPLTKCLLACYLTDSALQVINAAYTTKDSANWNYLRRQALFIKQCMIHRQTQEPIHLGIRINSKYADLYPTMAVDTTYLFFTRKVKNMDEDFFIAKLDSCNEWLRADNMGSPPNTIDNDAAQCISADGHYLFFARTDNRMEDGWAGGGSDLYMAYRNHIDSPWNIPQPFGGTINSQHFEGMPCLSPDNHTLYYVSDKPGGYGGFDIYMSTFDEGLWQKPINLGPKINTPYNETAPYISLDNTTLFFTSDGHMGMGGTDIYQTQRLGVSDFNAPQNLGYPINTSCNEQSCYIKPSGAHIYFSSDRSGPSGNYDIYQTEVPSMCQPGPMSILSGYVYDSLTKERLNFASIYLADANTGDTLYHMTSNRGDASFMVPLNKKRKYLLRTARVSYSEVVDTVIFDTSLASQTLNHPIVMLPSDYLAPINDSLVATIHFSINKVELSDSDKTNIRMALEPFMEDKSIMYFVNGYTDNTGNPMLNEELSSKRANTVMKELIGLGIDDLSIIAKGWGEANMVASNDTEEGQRRNRRVEIIIKR